jgi:DNA polymerase I-like protein with 3'-5' exonuclease and polymerase domains
LIYLDYAQFEPGVLAGLSGDAKLIAAYNDGDLYTALAEVLFGDSAQRPVAKRVFLAFSYGMTPDRIAIMLAGNAASNERGAYATKIATFFEAFPHLARFRISQQEALRADGHVASLLGNRRVRTSSGEHLSLKEQRWALNQPVQSTASLIFKEALNGIIAEFGVDPVILPVHDAVLLQFPDDEHFDNCAQHASEIMVERFSHRVPGVKARIKAGPFTD